METVLGSIVMLAQLGLEPGVLGSAYLIPYKKQCVAVPGWKGLLDLVSRAGRAWAYTGAVYDGDEFDYQYGDSPFVKHKPSELNDGNDDSKLRFVYAIGRVKGAEWPIIEVWSKSKCLSHRDKYNKVGQAHYSYKNFEMYARKLPLLQVIKYLPSSIEIQNAVQTEYASSQGVSINLEQAAAGYFPTIDSELNDTDYDSKSSSSSKLDQVTETLKNEKGV
jgi:recombination protein RecT